MKNQMLLTFSILLALYSCDSDNQAIEECFENLNLLLPQGQIDSISRCETMECYEGQIYHLVLSTKEQPPDCFQIVLDTLDSMDIRSNPSMVFIKAYSHYLRGEEYSIFDLDADIQKYYEKVELDRRVEQKLNRNRLLKIAESNFEKYSIDDTLILHFPLKSGDNLAAFYGSYDTSDFIDTLTLTCRVLHKWRDLEIGDQGDSLHDLNFSLFILSMNKPSYQVMMDKVEPSDTLDINIFDYGRVL